MSIPRLAVLPDFPEEGWPSMDLCAEMLLRELQPMGDRLDAQRIGPPYRRHFKYVPFASRIGAVRNIDRLLNRMRRYPRFAAAQSGAFDLFHICDHSYSQLLHALPAGRAGVLCHDLDTFRCVLNPAAEPRPAWFRKMVRTILSGFEKAAVVFYTTSAVRGQIERHGLVDPGKLVQVPLGVAEEFTSTGPGNTGGPYLLHVGSCIARKRIDVLLDVLAAILKIHPNFRLEQVGGDWTAEQRQQIGRLGIGGSLNQRRGLSRAQIATLYRGAMAVLVTSDAEGFGLPVIEAMACRATVIASDLPVLREVAGDAAIYCPVADVPMWVEQVLNVIEDPRVAPTPAARAAQAAKYSWRRHAEVIVGAYETLLTGARTQGVADPVPSPSVLRGEG